MTAEERDRQIDLIISRLPGEAVPETVGNLFDLWLCMALDICNRGDGEETPSLLAIVRETVLAGYLRRGDEGVTTSAVGGQTYQYVDLRQDMFDRLLQCNLRMFRL